MEDIDKDSQIQQHDILLSSSKPGRTDIASFHGQPSDHDCTDNSKHILYFNDVNSLKRHSEENQNVHNKDDKGDAFIPIKPNGNINRYIETNMDVHTSKSADDKGKIANDGAVSQSDVYAYEHEEKSPQDNHHRLGPPTDAVLLNTVEGKDKASLHVHVGNEQRYPYNGRPLSANPKVTNSLKKNGPEPFSTPYFDEFSCPREAKRQEQKFSNFKRRPPYDKGKDYGTLFIFRPGDLFILIILWSASTTYAAKCQFAGKEVLQKDNNLIMVICYDHTCSGNERWDNGTTSLHLNGPNGTNIMQGSYDIESNGSCSMLTIKDAKPKDYVQQYQFTKGTTPITISPLSSPILSNQHIESCVDGLESYELNLTVKHNSEEAVFRVTEPKVELTMTKMEIVPGFYESKIHMLYRQNGNTSTTNESSNGQNVTIQLMYTTRKDSDIILTKQIADLKCPLILPGVTEDASSTLIYILLPLVCIVMIVVVVIIYCKWEWIKIKFRKFRKKEPPVSDDELENLNSPTNEANSSNASSNNQNGINSSNARKKHQKGNKLST